MLARNSAGHQPQLTFTSDFHELVQGDLIGGHCVMRYDPFRIAKAESIAGRTSLPGRLTAQIVFHPGGERWSQQLEVQQGRALDMVPDPVGQGTMCKADFELPAGCQELECWFSYETPDGRVQWDSNDGSNYWLRFPTFDLKEISAKVFSSPGQAMDELEVELKTIAAVRTADVRWRVVQMPEQPRRSSELASVQTDDGGMLWKARRRIDVPHKSTIAFDIVYTIENRTFTDDNEGAWYIAD